MLGEVDSEEEGRVWVLADSVDTVCVLVSFIALEAGPCETKKDNPSLDDNFTSLYGDSDVTFLVCIVQR